MQNEQKNDLHQRITNQIIESIEGGAGDYQMPWNAKLCTGATIGLPHNPVGQYGYRGVNILSLWASQQSNAYQTATWATFKQWQSAGAQVRKGEKGTVTVFYKATESRDDATQDDTGQPKRHLVAKAAYVFNAAQVDGYEPIAAPMLPPIERHAAADALMHASSARIYHDGEHACYIPSHDEIHLPSAGAFYETQGYYSVALHELVHCTAHADRCDRDLHGRFGSDCYAAEELIAELGAAFLCAETGISAEPRIDHARYIESWLKILKGDKRAIFTAAAKASQAAAFLSQRPGTPIISG
ncbi:DUF1738 domain-containing protein [Undibacterium sp. 14-3-2]|uniref:ArdC family protein n=1 Tax=Undibacterium sp. 14-3-2 TaxID=2800129 RepID=UPI001907AC4F|nr:zincin-like metallopeptidase domain-containing protein [Undibacterium sp. 14-3-2]MBK1890086.1 DUF1738 domain-containing protein [Undibacterium sp. 14-3-2]